MHSRHAHLSLIVLLMTVVALFFVAIAQASGPKEAPKLAPKEAGKFGPFHSTSTDNGSCGQPWAQDIFDRFFKVRDNKDGTFNVREEFKNGVFITIGGPSPGSCETDQDHGQSVRGGVTGHFEGYLEGTVTSSTYNPNGCAEAGADCTTTQGFLLAAFGAQGPATFTCNLGFAGCRFNFEYTAGDQSLLFHHWADTSAGPGDEVFHGDIADQ
jgi:hypothetical protein